ncbi:MATE family efflux transporter [Caloranaerobacter azorensis]|uniref:Probable multidrug resistance protein NorM n=1 Tax=Caloranaerobacter azorensis TaxID=116090 RepID=A0A6P1YEI5_9FIRM|nr:MATE family efflux transporter [Caloranaerobacter azorensis]QIB27193.1 MATE family efflux transporter [Caloranaerobacter azorensis]
MILENNSRLKIIWNLAWPVMVSQILQTLLDIIDMYFVSNIGVNEAAAVGIGASIIGVIIVITQLIATGAIALISRKTGENDDKAVLEITGQALILSIAIGILISILGFSLSTSIIKLFGVEIEVAKNSINYLKIVSLSMPFVFFNLTGRAILQARGDTKTPMLIFGLMNLVNIILDPILIYGLFCFPRLMFMGAPLATAISNVFASVLMFKIILRKIFNDEIKKCLQVLSIKINLICKILKIGSYSAVQAISRPITGLVMYKIANYSGTKAVAAFTIGGRIFNLVFIFLAGLNLSISVLVGQNLGKKDIESAESIVKDGIKLALINMLIFSLPYFMFAKYLMFIFTKDFEVINIGANYLRIVYIGVIFIIYPIVYGGAFVGAGDTAPPMIASLVANLCFKLPMAYILSKVFNMGANGVWIAISLSVLLEAAIMIYNFRLGKWKNKNVF